MVSAAAEILTAVIKDEEINWASVGVAAVTGAASGALAATGGGLVAMIAGNAGISMVGNAVNQMIDNQGLKNFDIDSMLFDGAIGAVAGALGGKGKGNKNLMNLGKQTINRTFNVTKHRGLSAGFAEMTKAFSYYTKNTQHYYQPFFKNLLKDGFNSLGISLFTWGVRKW